MRARGADGLFELIDRHHPQRRVTQPDRGALHRDHPEAQRPLAEGAPAGERLAGDRYADEDEDTEEQRKKKGGK